MPMMYLLPEFTLFSGRMTIFPLFADYFELTIHIRYDFSYNFFKARIFTVWCVLPCVILVDML